MARLRKVIDPNSTNQTDDLETTFTPNSALASSLGLNTNPSVINNKVSVAIGLFVVSIATLGSVGNLWLIFVVTRNRKSRKRYSLIVQLSIAHLLAAGDYFLLARQIFSNQPVETGSKICLIDGYVLGVSSISTIYILLMITVEHYLVTQYPFMVNRFTWTKKLALVFLSYVIAVAITVPPYFGWGAEIRSFGYGWFCSFDMYDNGWNNRSYFIVLFIVSFILPLASMIVMYAWIWRKSFSKNVYQRSSGTIPLSEQSNSNSVSSPNDRYGRELVIGRQLKYLFTSLSIIFSLTCSWMPFAVISVLVQFTTIRFPPITVELCAIFAKSFILWNPVMHAVNDPKFRSESRRCMRTIRSQLIPCHWLGGGRHPSDVDLATVTSGSTKTGRHRSPRLNTTSHHLMNQPERKLTASAKAYLMDSPHITSRRDFMNNRSLSTESQSGVSHHRGGGSGRIQLDCLSADPSCGIRGGDGSRRSGGAGGGPVSHRKTTSYRSKRSIFTTAGRRFPQSRLFRNQSLKVRSNHQ